VSSKVGTNRPAISIRGTGLQVGQYLLLCDESKVTAKSITSFDGFSAISSTVNLFQ
jgi:hypothetical protein